MVNADGEGADAGGGDPMCVDENAGAVVGADQCEEAGPQGGGAPVGLEGTSGEGGQVPVSHPGGGMRVRGATVEEESEEAPTVQGSKEGAEELLLKVVYSEEEAYKLYCDYGHHTGFSVRKGKQSYFTGTKRIRTKDYFCSKEGLKEAEKLTDENFNDPHTRTNCRAMVRFRVNSQGEWRVIRLVSDHNHNLVRPEERHLLRSAKSLIAGRSCSAADAVLYGGYQLGGVPSQMAASTSVTKNAEAKQDLLPGFSGVTRTSAVGTGELQSIISTASPAAAGRSAEARRAATERSSWLGRKEPAPERVPERLRELLDRVPRSQLREPLLNSMAVVVDVVGCLNKVAVAVGNT
ncbi:hypothetical protein ZWY2020_047776 [Hordeum vulgare]|nr:hypothetical protein ZWY2020_047776 [Hordeum vulgare]